MAEEKSARAGRGSLAPLALTTLRGRLTVAATAGLLVTVGMTAVLVGTARTAGEVVEAAQVSHERTQTFSRLQFDTDRFQQATYAAVRTLSAANTKALAEARANFVRSLDRTSRLTIRNRRDAIVARRVRREGEAALRLFSAGAAIVARVDARWRNEGSIAALEEVQRLSKPYFDLIATATQEIARGDDDIRAAANRARRLQRAVLPTALAAIICSLLLSGLTLLIVLTRLLPGLRRLEEGARSLGEEGTTRHIALEGHDELARLAHAFDAMADQIATQREALRDTAETLEEAVAARTRELEDAHAALAAEDHRRRIFFAEVSHELRTPLTIIQGEAQIALRNAGAHLGDPMESFERILEQSKDLSRLVRDLFLIARAEADGLELHLEAVEIAPLLERLAHDFEASTADLGACIRVEAEKGIVLRGDRTRVRQMLGALIDNALVHTRPGVQIVLVARRSGVRVLLSVEDNGPGVDPVMAEQLLLRFRRGNSQAEGAGLGLTIVRALAEAQGGKVRLVNRREGGLRVEITMPAEPATREDEGDVEPASGGGC